jgi:hypothetical protein
MELLLGCGSNRDKRIHLGNKEWSNLVTLDFNADHSPDVVHDISKFPLPFQSDTFDEIHAYEVMEHVGTQGDWRFFFDQWSDLWRIMKHGALFYGTSPAPDSVWAWGDPGHTRVLCPQNMIFLNQPSYTDQVGKTPMSDYRFVYQADFDLMHCANEGETFIYILRAIKPSRCSLALERIAA